MKRVLCFIVSAFVLVAIFFLPAKNTRAQVIDSWTNGTSIPASISGHYSFVHGDYIYVLDGSNSGVPTVGLRASVSSNGDVSSWENLSSLPPATFWVTGASKGLSTYVLGGARLLSNNSVLNTNAVYYGEIGVDGDINSWQAVESLPVNPGVNGYSLGASVIANNRIYFAGGNTFPNYNAASGNQNIYMAEINPDNGMIGPWTIAGTLPEQRLGLGMMEINGYLYIFGGKTTTGTTTSVKMVPIDSDGKITLPWQNGPSLPYSLWRFGITRSGNILVTVGGQHTDSELVKNVYYSSINSDGTISPWQEGPFLVNQNCCGSLVSWDNFIYLIGGVTNGSYSNEVLRSEIVYPSPPPQLTIIKHVINSDGGIKQASDFTLNIDASNPSLSSFQGSEDGTTITLSAGTYNVSEEPQTEYSVEYEGCSGTILDGEKKTCTIINDDIAPPTPTPFPVTKVFFAPGLGGSWNADALLNCKKTGYSGAWTLAPFAKNIYNPLLENLTLANWEAKPFYYDWRQDARDSAGEFTEYIDTNTAQNEKVNIVGHSLGGLVGRAYLENQSGGKASKFLSVGSPNQGSVLTYPIVSGNEVWTSDLVERIATTLYLNRCGVPDSARNMLPTFDYLRNASTKQLKPVASMSARNNWLPTNFSAPFWGVKVGTLAGTGFPTLKALDVVNASKRDLKSNLWIDGKPIGREKTSAGDGTVLVESAQIPEAFSNTVIGMSHSGIIASTEGVSKILEFLGSPGIADPPYSDPSSALVVVGYPGNFWVKDSKGNIFQSEDGIVTIFNPESQDYELQVVPQSDNTLLIVEQLLPDNRAFYKEYHLKGIAPKSKDIKFNAKHPSNDILKDKSPPKKPKGPRSHNWEKFWQNLPWFKRSK